MRLLLDFEPCLSVSLSLPQTPFQTLIQFTHSCRNYRNKRQLLASVAKGMANKVAAAKSMPQWVIDNMDFSMQWFTHHFTQSVLVFKNVKTKGLNEVIWSFFE